MDVYEPAEQSMHEVTPVVPWNVPAGHVWQTVLPEPVEYMPVLQS